jgi:multidrug efflux system membrane fusion protein
MTSRLARFAVRAGIGAAALCVAAMLTIHRPAAQTAPPSGPPTVPVATSVAKQQDMPVYLRGLGQVQAFQQVLVRARVDGTLDKVTYTEGQEVNPGDVLVEIDPRPYQAALDAALAKKASDQAQLANLKLDLTRYANLAQKQFASQQQVDQQHASVAQMEATIQGDDAAIATARLNLDFTRITSPIQGRVGLRQVDVGNLVHANDLTGLVTITQTKPISVVFTLPQADLPSVAAAMKQRKLIVLAYAPDDKTLLGAGELLTPDNSIDPNTGTIKLKATFPNQQETLWPGQFVNVRLLLDTLPQVVTVPSVAVQHGPNGLFVFAVKPDNTIAMQTVTMKQDDGGVAVIESGVAVGDQVVVNGQSKIQNGTRVAATDADSKSSGAATKPMTGG